MLNIHKISDIDNRLRNLLIIRKMKNSHFYDLYFTDNQLIGYDLAEKLSVEKFGDGLHMRYLCSIKSVERELPRHSLVY